MTVIIDTHEKAGIIDRVMDAAEGDAEVRSGFGADYIVNDIVIERKTFKELPGRMMDNENDLYHQLYKAMNTADELTEQTGRQYRAALLLEGYMAELEHTAIPMDNVLKYLHGAYKMDMDVMLSTGKDMTAELLAKLNSDHLPSTDSLRPPAKVRPEDRPQYILEGFDGVGPSTALDILDHFETARAALTASTEELQEVDGVGPATASSIVDPLDMEVDG